MADDAQRSHAGAWLLAIVAVIAVAIALAWQQQWIRLPPNALPWQTPDLTQPPGWFAHTQVRRLAVDADRCLAALSGAGVEVTRLRDQRMGDECGFTNVVRIDRAPIAFDRKATATCGVAAALAWYQHELTPIAERVLGARIVRIDQLGTFACRNVNAAPDGARSQHATANAIDITAYALSDHRVISVARDWNASTPEGRFLAEAHAAACGVFNGVLGPDYNRLHANHFHLDLGAYRVCR